MNVTTTLGGFLVALAGLFGVAYLGGTQSQALLAPAPRHDVQLPGRTASVDGYTLSAVQPEQRPAADTFVELLRGDAASTSSGSVVAPGPWGVTR